MGDVQRFSLAGPAGVLSGLQRLGSGTATLPAIFVHGINGAAEQWLTVMDQLADRTSVAIDLRGHGDSQAGGPYGAADYATDVAACMDHLGIARAHLIGASFGGGVCLTLAANHPERIQSLSIIGGALSVAQVADVDAVVGALHQLGVEAFFGEVAASSFAPNTDDRLIHDSVLLARRNDSATVERILRAALTDDVTIAAAHVGANALVVTGEHDHTCPPALGAALAEALHTQCRVLSGRGHMAHVEDPVGVAQLLDEHLCRTEQPASAPTL
jgi:3-oxoadipate enol-lactonase